MANLKFSDVFRALNIGFGEKEEEIVTIITYMAILE